MKLSRHAIAMAMKIKNSLTDMGIPFLMDSPTNQQFPIFPDALLPRIAEKYGFSYEKRIDESHSAIRFCTSWATKEENVDSLLADIKKMM
jgi:threonine aldolase